MDVFVYRDVFLFFNKLEKVQWLIGDQNCAFGKTYV